jgi:hypothetical protein
MYVTSNTINFTVNITIIVAAAAADDDDVVVVVVMFAYLRF